MTNLFLSELLELPFKKKGDLKDVSSYQPIALVPPISNIFEHIMKAQLTDCFENDDIFHRLNTGFSRKNPP